MKKIIYITILVYIVFCSHNIDAEALSNGNILITLKNKVGIPEKPSIDSKRIGYIERNQFIIFKGETFNDYYYIKTEESLSGWVSKKTVKKYSALSKLNNKNRKIVSLCLGIKNINKKYDKSKVFEGTKKIKTAYIKKYLNKINYGKKIYQMPIAIDDCIGGFFIEECYSNNIYKLEHNVLRQLILVSNYVPFYSIKEGMEASEVETKLGKPYAKTKNMLVYLSETPNGRETGYFIARYEIKFSFSSKKKLKYITIYHYYDDC